VDDARQCSWSRCCEELIFLDHQACLLHRPNASGCQPGTQSLWFGKVLPCLVAKPFFGGVATHMSPQAATVKPGPRALGLTLSDLITPHGLMPSSDHPYPRVCEHLSHFILLWWRRFETSGGHVIHVCVRGEAP
jgi:hypothetical protein